MSLLKIFIISFILIALCFAAMAFNIIFRKNGKFPSYRVGHNKNMKKLGITCVKHEELSCHNKAAGSGCMSCCG